MPRTEGSGATVPRAAHRPNLTLTSDDTATTSAAGRLGAGDPTLQTPVTDLNAYHRNPRRGDVDAIAASLRTNGQYKPVTVNVGTHTGRPAEILAGNHTVAAARQLGWSHVAAVWVDVDEAEARKIVLADNATSDAATYSTPDLTGLLADLDGDYDGTGWTPESALDYLDPAAASGADKAPATGYLPDDDEVEDMDGYSEQFGVIILCEDSGAQARTFDALRALGYTARVVTT